MRTRLSRRSAAWRGASASFGGRVPKPFARRTICCTNFERKAAAQPPVSGLHEDVAIELNLLEVGDYIAEHELGRFDAIEAIRGFDADHRTDFLITLRAYLDANGNIAQTAKRLHVHGNTIRYRIARLEEDFQVDLDEPATRLWLWLRLASQRD